MKKILLIALVLILAGGLFAGSGVRLGLKGGVLTDSSFHFDPFIWTAGVDIDLQVSDSILITPEAQLVFSKLDFKDIWIFPAVTANYVAGSFFIGGGVGKFVHIVKDVGTAVSDDFSLKLNAGLINSSFKLTAYVITSFDNILKKDYTTVGATIGFFL